jgi:hypothetical protein|nr:MAG TPA: Baseplate component [Caudoviricetes sp.]
MNKTVSLNVATGPWEEIIHYVQYSTEIPIEFHIKDYSLPAGATARFYLKKPSGLEIYNECEIDGNTVTLKPTGQTFAESGKQSGQIQIVKSDKILVSYIIHFDIEKNLIDESAIPSSNEFGILDELITEAQTAISEADDATEATNTATSAANAAASNANQKANAANTAATAATTAASNANTATTAANSAASNANQKASAANTAATAANTAAQAANTAAAGAQEVIDTASNRLVPQGGTENQVLVKGTTDPEWSSDLDISTLTVAGVDMTITEEEYNQLMAELDET